MGGQLPASLIYTVETKPKERWGYYGSLVMVRRSLSFVALVCKVIGIQLTEFALIDGIKRRHLMRQFSRSTPSYNLDRRTTLLVGLAFAISLGHFDCICGDIFTILWRRSQHSWG